MDDMRPAADWNIYITAEGIWIRHNVNDLSPYGYRFNGSVFEFFNILQVNDQINIESVNWIVRESLTR